MQRTLPRRIATISLAFGLFVAGCGGSKADRPQEKAAAKSDADQLQGTWTPVASSDNGKTISRKEDRHGKIVIAGDEFDMYELAAPQPRKWTFHLDAATNPKQIDFEMGGQQARGIYQLDGDQLKIAMTLPGKSRPVDFNGAPDTLVLELNRGDAVPTPR